jgi:hypothetical protein
MRASGGCPVKLCATQRSRNRQVIGKQVFVENSHESRRGGIVDAPVAGND